LATWWLGPNESVINRIEKWWDKREILWVKYFSASLYRWKKFLNSIEILQYLIAGTYCQHRKLQILARRERKSPIKNTSHPATEINRDSKHSVKDQFKKNFKLHNTTNFEQMRLWVEIWNGGETREEKAHQ